MSKAPQKPKSVKAGAKPSPSKKASIKKSTPPKPGPKGVTAVASTRKRAASKPSVKKAQVKKAPAKKRVVQSEVAKVDLSLVVNTHTEGAIVIPTLKSAHMAVQKAVKSGLNVEFLVLCDNADQATLSIVKTYAKKLNFTYKQIAVKDLGMARNAGAKYAKGEIIAFMDGDDLMSENWLLQGCKFARKLGPDVILHPEMNYVFGPMDTYIYLHRDMDDKNFDLRVLLLQNYWTALSIGHKETYLKYPYEPNRIKEGWGFEDWGWNILTISHGLKHKTVPNTAHYIRKKKKDSLLSLTVANHCLPRLYNLREAAFEDVKNKTKKSRAAAK